MFSYGRKNSKTTGKFFLKFQHHINSNMWMCKLIFKDATEIQNGRQGSTPKKFVGAKTLKLKVRNYSHSPPYGDVQVTFQGFTEIQNGRHGSASIHITSNLWMCNWFFKDAPKFKMAAISQFQIFLWGAKTLKLNVRNYSNFTITFPTIWRCAGDFFKVLLRFKMAATDQFNFFEVAKT